MRDTVKLIITSVIWCVTGVFIGAAIVLVIIKTDVANGELDCKYVHEKRICWNPKEVQDDTN
jgi:hypothetical protein